MPLSDDSSARVPDKSGATPTFWLVIGGIGIVGLLAIFLGPAMTEFLTAHSHSITDSTGSDSSRRRLDVLSAGKAGVVRPDDASAQWKVEAQHDNVVSTPRGSGASVERTELAELRGEVRRLREQLEQMDRKVSSKQQAAEYNGDIDPSGFTTSHDVAQLDEKLDSLEKEFVAAMAQMQSLVRTATADADAAQVMGALKTEFAGRLENVEKATRRLDLKTRQFDRFGESELPALRRATGRLMETRGRENLDLTQRSSQAPTFRRGKLIIDNDTGRNIRIVINGRDEQLRLGRNTYMVEFGNVQIGGEGTSWLLDSSLWSVHEGEQVLYRPAWPPGT